MSTKAIDITRIRADTPGCEQRNHLNNAGAALMPLPVVQAIVDHISLETEIGGYEASDERRAAIDQCYADIAALVGARARNIAVVANATAGFIQALSSFDFEPGDLILTSRCDYASNQIQYLALARRRGVRIEYAEDLPEGGVDPDSVRERLRDRQYRLVALTWVPTSSGLVQDVESVGKICEGRGVPYLIDACQAIGQMPINVEALVCDYLSVTARKFLREPRGVGFLYASDKALKRGDHPLFVDMRGARWIDAETYAFEDSARRYEDWEFPYALVLGQGAAVRYALDVGIEAAQTRAWALAAYARERLERILTVRLLDRGRNKCAIVTASMAGKCARDAVPYLRDLGINTSAALREHSLFDFEKKRVQSALRISPHYYNTEAEIDSLVEALWEFAAS